MQNLDGAGAELRRRVVGWRPTQGCIHDRVDGADAVVEARIPIERHQDVIALTAVAPQPVLTKVDWNMPLSPTTLSSTVGRLSAPPRWEEAPPRSRGAVGEADGHRVWSSTWAPIGALISAKTASPRRSVSQRAMPSRCVNWAWP